MYIEHPLQWWASESSKYPCLSQLAMKYLLVYATNSPSEHVFSASGKIVTPLRSNLKPDKVDKLDFCLKTYCDYYILSIDR